MIMSMVHKEKHLLKIGYWKLKKEYRKPSTMEMIATIAMITRIPCPTKYQTPRV